MLAIDAICFPGKHTLVFDFKPGFGKRNSLFRFLGNSELMGLAHLPERPRRQNFTCPKYAVLEQSPRV